MTSLQPTGATRSGMLSEARTLLHLAGPVMVAQFAQTATGFVDTLMAGQAGAKDLAAVALGTSIWLPLFLFSVGIMTATSAIVSHLYGAGRKSKIGNTVHQAVWLSVPLGFISVVLLRNTTPLLEALKVEADLIPLTQAYLNGISWGFPAICTFLAMRFYAEGMGQPRSVMLVSVLGLAANVPANYLLIFGKFGFPAMGGPGCGIATAWVMWLMAVMMFVCCRRLDRVHQTQFGWGWGRIDGKQVGALIMLGMPIGLSIFFEVSIFCVIALLLATLGTAVIAGHQVALNVASLLFMIPLSLSLAIGVRLGHCVGASDAERLKFAAIAGMLLVLVCATMNATIMGLARGEIASLYSNDPAVVDLATHLLLLAAFFQLSDGLQVGANGALRGLKDTRIPMLITLLSYWFIGLGVGYCLGFGVGNFAPMGAEGFWIGLVAGLTSSAILLNVRFYHLVKRQVKVMAD